MARPNLTTSTKVLLAANRGFLVSLMGLCVTSLIDFFFIGHHGYDITFAIGFALVVGGSYKNKSGFLTASASSDQPVSAVAIYAGFIGALLVVGSEIAWFIARFNL